MHPHIWTHRLLIATLAVVANWFPVSAGDPAPTPPCTAADSFITDVWAKVGERTCWKCHHAEGDAADSDFLLHATTRDRAADIENRRAFVRMATSRDNGTSRLLAKATGGLDHGGGAVLKPGSEGYRILERFVQQINGSATAGEGTGAANTGAAHTNVDAIPYFANITMLPPDRLLRRVTLSLGGRLPTAEERTRVQQQGLAAIDGILTGVMQEDAFYTRLKEGFNDIFLTWGYDGNGEQVLSYEHFDDTRYWTEKYDLSHIPEKERQRARWKLADVYREAVRREPMELIEHIVRHDRPFTEIATADYIMVSPYSARGYGVFEQMRDEFDDPDAPFEYHPVKLKALTSRDGKVQESATGDYPHAGLLSMFHSLRRYPTTETNRNRLRARMYYQHFLGVDVMALAPRVTDAAAVTAKYEVPTMQAADCVVCHQSVDPLAGLFQDFNKDGHLGPRQEGWYADMFAPGFEDEPLPPSERWRSLQWLGERTAQDPRFATAMVEHVYDILFGRKVLKAPEDISDPQFSARRRAWQEQRRLIEEVAERFAADHFNLKVAFRGLVASSFYRTDGLATAIDDPCRLAELDNVGLVRLLTPEQLERKIAAVFGEPWGKLTDSESKLDILYGGIDSKSVTERMHDPSGAMGAIQRIMANEIACRHVAADFSKPPEDRRLFPAIEPDDIPGSSDAADERIRAAIVHLHAHILGVHHPIDHPEVTRTYDLFAGIIADAQATEGVAPTGSYFCERINEERLDDAEYTLRAWRGVVTYLLRQHEFLYE